MKCNGIIYFANVPSRKLANVLIVNSVGFGVYSARFGDNLVNLVRGKK